MAAAEDSFRAGDLAQALAQLQADVRQRPADAKLRIFLTQLLMVLGQWDRALTQLKVLEEMDASTLPMVRTYETAIRCERLRRSVFAGERSPLVFGDPQPWLALLVQSLGLLSKGHVAQATELRAQAFEAAPTSGGTLNGIEFSWIADVDSRLGPVFEALINGSYYWVPINRLKRLVIEPPRDIRDLVWLPAQFTWTNGGETEGFMPVRYPSSEDVEDNAVRLARKTEWQQQDDSTTIGIGQRVISTDNIELGLLEVRELIITDVSL